eukprot:14135063-Ditylum_brightwellii.AAC.2
MIGHCHDKKEVDDWSVQCTQRTRWPWILCDGNMIGNYNEVKEEDYRHNHNKKKGDGRSMCCTHRANQPPILHDGNIIGCYHEKKGGDD